MDPINPDKTVSEIETDGLPISAPHSPPASGANNDANLQGQQQQPQPQQSQDGSGCSDGSGDLDGSEDLDSFVVSDCSEDLDSSEDSDGSGDSDSSDQREITDQELLMKTTRELNKLLKKRGIDKDRRKELKQERMEIWADIVYG